MHRNSQKRFYDPNHIYFLTTKTKQNFPYFSEPIFCELFLSELKLMKKIKEVEVFAFCVLFDHVHLLIRCGGRCNVSEFMRALKTNFSRNANDIISGKPKMDKSKAESRDSAFINHFHLVELFQNQFIFKYGTQQYQIPPFKWQLSFHDHVIRGGKDLENHFNYCVYNFQKHKLPHDWKWTSLNFPEMIDFLE
jgi:REP element-mobilizing transposase RayT